MPDEESFAALGERAQPRQGSESSFSKVEKKLTKLTELTKFLFFRTQTRVFTKSKLAKLAKFGATDLKIAILHF